MTQIPDSVVFPQDPGNASINEEEADYSSAGLFGAQVSQDNISSYKDGVGVTADFANNTFSLGSGVVFLDDDRVVSVQDNEGTYVVDWNEGTSLVVQIPGISGVAFNQTSEDFDVFAVVDPSGNNVVEVEQYTIASGTTPSNPYLKIGRIRISDQTVTDTYTEPVNTGTLGKVLDTVKDGEKVVIEEGESMVVPESYAVEGELQVNGTLKVI